MAVRFKKRITRAGVVVPKDLLTGGRKVEVLTTQDIDDAAATGNEMLADNLLIPAPYGHTDKDGIYPIPLLKDPNDPNSYLDAKTPIAEGKKPKWDLANNSGFYTEFGTETDEQGQYWLTGIQECEGDVEDENTHAGRVGKTFRQTSPLLVRNFMDGEGRLRKLAPLHVCVTNKAVQSNQENFKVLPSQEQVAKQGLTEPELAIAMALEPTDFADGIALADNEVTVVKGPGLSPGLIGKLTKLLKEKLGVTLPADSDTDNFPDRLLTILTNMEPRKEGANSMTELPDGAQPLSTPTIMSLAGTPPATLSAEDTAFLGKARKQAEGILSQAVLTIKQRSTDRLQAALKTGQVGAKKAERLTERINALSLSLDDLADDGSVTASPQVESIELDLSDIEANEPLVGTAGEGGGAGTATLPPGAVVPGATPDLKPPGAAVQVTKEEANEFWKNTVGNVGFQATY